MIRFGNNINKIHFKNEIAAVYSGSSLVWQKVLQATGDAVWRFKGKVTDTFSGNKIKVRFNPSMQGVSSLEIPVDINKEFDYIVPEERRNLVEFYVDSSSKSYIKEIEYYPSVENVYNNSICNNMYYLTTFNGRNYVVNRSTTSFENMFNNCLNLTSLDLTGWNTSNITNMSSMFYGCGNLTTINFGNLDLSNCTNLTYMFQSCGLKNISGSIRGIKVDLDISTMTFEDANRRNNVLFFINGLERVSSTKRLKVSNVMYNSLQDEDIALATSKGWSVYY